MSKYPSLMSNFCRLLLVATDGRRDGWRPTRKRFFMPDGVETQPVSESTGELLVLLF